MINCVIVRKVPYRIPRTNRLVWGVVLAEREGLSLVFVQKPDENRSHAIVFATENVVDRVFEDANVSRFPLEHQDLADVGSTLQALGDGMDKAAFDKFFRPDDRW